MITQKKTYVSNFTFVNWKHLSESYERPRKVQTVMKFLKGQLSFRRDWYWDSIAVSAIERTKKRLQFIWTDGTECYDEEAVCKYCINKAMQLEELIGTDDIMRRQSVSIALIYLWAYLDLFLNFALSHNKVKENARSVSQRRH